VGWLHHCGIMHHVCMDVVDTVHLAETNSSQSAIEMAVDNIMLASG
jgi:hypothetical protein